MQEAQVLAMKGVPAGWSALKAGMALRCLRYLVLLVRLLLQQVPLAHYGRPDRR